MNKLAVFALVLMTLGGATLAYSSITIIRNSQITFIIPGGGGGGTAPPPPTNYDFTVPVTVDFGTLDFSLTKTVQVTIENPTQTTYSVTISSTPPLGIALELIGSPASIAPGTNTVDLKITADPNTTPGPYSFTVSFIGVA